MCHHVFFVCFLFRYLSAAAIKSWSRLQISYSEILAVRDLLGLLTYPLHTQTHKSIYELTNQTKL